MRDRPILPAAHGVVALRAVTPETASHDDRGDEFDADEDLNPEFEELGFQVVDHFGVRVVEGRCN